MKEKYTNDTSVIRLHPWRFNSNNIFESCKGSQYTSYSVNKSEKIVFCIRQKDDNEILVDENTVTFVVIHELAHIMIKSVDHTQEFWDNFTAGTILHDTIYIKKIILTPAIKIWLYQLMLI